MIFIMNDKHIDIIGYIGCFFLFISFIPQTIDVIKTKKTENISKRFIRLIIITSIILSFYSYLKKVYPILLSNISVFINNTIIYYIKCRNEKNRRNEDIFKIDI